VQNDRDIGVLGQNACDILVRLPGVNDGGLSGLSGQSELRCEGAVLE
jgi:hypothetical protein